MRFALHSAPAADPVRAALPVGSGGGWTIAAYVYALTVAAGVAYCVWGIPVQLSDSLGNMLQVQDVPLARVLQDQLGGQGYMRPLLWAQIKVIMDASAGHYFAAFKTVHALQLAALALLFVRPLRIRSAADFWPLPLAVAVLVGIHTFSGTVREAFPVNSFLSVIVCCLAALNLSASRGDRIWKDAAAALLVAFATFTVESGVLVFVCLLAAWLAGLRGVSMRGVAAGGIVLAAYLLARFAWLEVGVPGLAERPSGFGFAILEPDQLQARFGGNRLLFYSYNVAASLLSVLFSEPRNGVFWAARSLTAGGSLPAWLWINLVSSTLATALVAWHLAARARTMRAGLTEHDRLALVSAAVLVANAAIGFGYTKDVIVSAGGVFYALLVYLAAHALIRRFPSIAWRPARAAVVALACVAAIAWSAREVSLFFNLRQWAARERTEWAHAYDWLESQRIPHDSPGQRALVAALQADALSRPVPPPVNGRWLEWLDLN